jgi:thiosulfate reductase cytochrome b subunit
MSETRAISLEIELGKAEASSGLTPAPQHSAMVRATHWVHAFGFFALLVSGGAILLAHPRLYWGEVGALGSPALIDLPIPLNGDHSGWGRSLHFLGAWVCVLNGTLYGVWGLAKNHFGKFPDKYNPLQRGTYLTVVFALFPLIVVTGLAMSPAVTAAVPWIVEVFGGHQSARTVHFFLASLLVLFLVAHVSMAILQRRIGGMMTGR